MHETASTSSAAIYDYTAQLDTELTIAAGDVLEIVEPEHEGTAGWTRVRNAANDEGLVPTSYLNTTP